MEKTVAKFIVKFRLPILIVILLITGIFFWGLLQKLSIKVIIDELVPPSHHNLKVHKEFLDYFGGVDMTLIEVRVIKGDIFNVKTMEKIKRIDEALYFNPDVRRALIFSIVQRKMKKIKGFGGGLDVSGMAWPDLPKSPQDFEELKWNIYTNELYKGVLVSEDGEATLLFCDLMEGVNYSEFFQFLQKLKTQEEDDNTRIHIAGRPVLYGWIFKFLPEITVIFCISIIFMIIILFLFLPSVIGVLVPLFCGLLTTIWGLGFCSLTNININPLMICLPFLVGARAISHSIQITRRYYDELQAMNGDHEKAVLSTTEHMLGPSLAAILTDAAGFTILVIAKIPMIQRMAIFCTFWVISIFILVEIFGPIFCFYLPKIKKVPAVGSQWVDQALMRLANWSMGSGRLIVVLTTLSIACIAIYFSGKLVVGDIFPGSPILWEDSIYNRDTNEINSRFEKAGTDTLNIVIVGKELTMKKNEVLNVLDKFEQYITRHPEIKNLVGGVQSLSPIVKKLSMEMHEGDPKFSRIPTTLSEIASYLFMYQSAGDPEDFNRYTDAQFQYGNIIIFVKDHRTETIKKVIKICEGFFKNTKLPEDTQLKKYGGGIGIIDATNEEIKKSNFFILPGIVIIIFTFCLMFFRSFVAAFILVFPLIIANLVAYSYMALNNIAMDVNTLPIASVGIGLGVDYGIYLLKRLQEEIAIYGNLEKAIEMTAATTVKAIFYTAFILTFSVSIWYFTNIKFLAEMGFLLGFILFFNCLAAVLWQPAIISLVKPKFILNLIESEKR